MPLPLIKSFLFLWDDGNKRILTNCKVCWVMNASITLSPNQNLIPIQLIKYELKWFYFQRRVPTLFLADLHSLDVLVSEDTNFKVITVGQSALRIKLGVVGKSSLMAKVAKLPGRHILGLIINQKYRQIKKRRTFQVTLSDFISEGQLIAFHGVLSRHILCRLFLTTWLAGDKKRFVLHLTDNIKPLSFAAHYSLISCYGRAEQTS